MGLISKEVPPEPPVRPGGRRACPRRLGAAHAGRPPPTLASLQKRCADAVQTQSRFSLHTHRPATG
jgi:hypothetical protein